MDELFTQIGGARMGWFNASWPFATIHATTTTLRLSCLSREFHFTHAGIRGLSRHTGFFSTGLRIEHQSTSYPGLLVFWTFDFEKLKTELERLGYEVRD